MLLTARRASEQQLSRWSDARDPFADVVDRVEGRAHEGATSLAWADDAAYTEPEGIQSIELPLRSRVNRVCEHARRRAQVDELEPCRAELGAPLVERPNCGRRARLQACGAHRNGLHR